MNLQHGSCLVSKGDRAALTILGSDFKHLRPKPAATETSIKGRKVIQDSKDVRSEQSCHPSKRRWSVSSLPGLTRRDGEVAKGLFGRSSSRAFPEPLIQIRMTLHGSTRAKLKTSRIRQRHVQGKQREAPTAKKWLVCQRFS